MEKWEKNVSNLKPKILHFKESKPQFLKNQAIGKQFLAKICEKLKAPWAWVEKSIVYKKNSSVVRHSNTGNTLLA